MPVTVVCWKWRPPPGFWTEYDAGHVHALRAMVARHYRRPHEFVCITDDPRGLDPSIRVIPLWPDHAGLPGPHGVSCYRRLRAFAADAADWLGPRIVSLDLDTVLVGDVAPLWDRPEDFVIWGDTARGTPYNGSMWLLRAGTRRPVWETFDPATSPARARALGYIGSDQAWIGACLGPSEPKWSAADGVYSWRVHVKRAGGALPPDARVVFFHGREKPWAAALQARYPWIAAHYPAEAVAA